MFSSTFSRSFKIVVESFYVLRKDKEMLWFPILSLIINGLLYAIFMIYFMSYMMTKFYSNEIIIEGDKVNFPISMWVDFLILFFFLDFLFILVNGFFKAGLMTCAYKRFNGEDPTFGDGFDNAKKHIEKIYLWSLISAFINLILKIIENISKNVSQALTKRFILILIGTSVFKVSWHFVTYFVMPVIIFEEKNIKDSIKESFDLFKKTWGEQVIVPLYMLGFFGILFIIIFFPLFFMILITDSLFLNYLFFSFAIIFAIILSIVASTLEGIFNTALYIYAKTGKIPSGYSPEVIKYAFIQNTPQNQWRFY